MIRTLLLASISLLCVQSTFSEAVSIESVPSQAKTVTSLADYQGQLTDKKLVITMFTANYCSPCKIMKPHFHASASLHPDIQFCIVNTERGRFNKLMKEHNIKSIPTLIFSYNGKKIMETSGGLTRAGIETEIRNFRAKITREQKRTQTQQKSQPAKKAAQPQQRRTQPIDFAN